jgi:hypothetical protein
VDIINVGEWLAVGNPKIRGHFGDLGIDGWIILKPILKKQNVKLWSRFI